MKTDEKTRTDDDATEPVFEAKTVDAAAGSGAAEETAGVEEKKAERPEGTVEEKTAGSAPVPDKTAAEVESVEELKRQITEARNDRLKLLAEFDNFKRRTAREYEKTEQMANKRIIGDLVEVRETFERALNNAADASGNPAGFLEGMKLLFLKFDQVLEKHGLVAFAQQGEPFSPELHDAFLKVSHETVPEDHLVDVFEKGYKLKGEIIRHARVSVSSGRPATAQDD